MSRSVRELMDLAGRRVLVTGAAGHVGREAVAALAELGADVAGLDLDGEATRRAVEAVPGDGARLALAADLGDTDRIDAAVDLLLGEWSGLDVLVHCAAFVGTSDLEGWAVPFARQSTQTWRRALDVNLTSLFHLARRLEPALRASPGGSIVAVGSIYGHLGPDWRLYDGTDLGNPAAYAASKAGLAHLTRWLATTLAPDVRANTISPGGIERGQPEAFRRRYEARTPLGRMATEEDLKGAVAYLASDLSRYVTGQCLMVDGGWSAW